MRATNLSLPAVRPILGDLRNVFCYRSYRKDYDYYTHTNTRKFTGWKLRPIWYTVAIGSVIIYSVTSIIISVQVQNRDQAKQTAAIAAKHHYKNGEAAFCNEDKNDSSDPDLYWTPCKVITQVDNTNYSVSYKGWDNNNYYTNTTSVADMKTKEEQ